MNEIYTECLVKREKRKEMTALAVLALVGAIFFGAAIFVIGLWGFVGFAVMCMLSYTALQMRYVEYEYLLAGNELTIDRIMNRSNRKKVAAYTFDEIQAAAPEHTDKVKELDRNVTKSMDFSSGRTDAFRYVLICLKSGKYEKLFIEPDEKMVKGLKQALPRKFTDKSY